MSISAAGLQDLKYGTKLLNIQKAGFLKLGPKLQDTMLKKIQKMIAKSPESAQNSQYKKSLCNVGICCSFKDKCHFAQSLLFYLAANLGNPDFKTKDCKYGDACILQNSCNFVHTGDIAQRVDEGKREWYQAKDVQAVNRNRSASPPELPRSSLIPRTASAPLPQSAPQYRIQAGPASGNFRSQLNKRPEDDHPDEYPICESGRPFRVSGNVVPSAAPVASAVMSFESSLIGSGLAAEINR